MNENMIKYDTIIDLTYDIEEGMTTFNARWHPRVSIKQLGRIGMEGRETRKLSFGTHTGTHIDAPLHFIENGNSVEHIPLKKLIGKITFVDFSDLEKNTPITKDILEKISVSEKMVFKFGWQKYWGTKEFYLDYPYFTKDGADYLISKGVQLIGYDTPSPDNSHTEMGSSEDSIIHKIFLSNCIILVEYLANLDKITLEDDWNIVALPLKIKNGDGSPCRVLLLK